MQLHEEYFQRHELQCPVIKRPETTDRKMVLVYRANRDVWGHSWVVFQIVKKPENFHPFYYQFSWMTPRPNGSSNGSNFQNHLDPKRVEWEEYEREIIEVAKRSIGGDITPVADLSEARLVVWEMFVYCTDERLSDFPPDIRWELYKSLDDDLTIEQRMQSQENVTNWAQVNNGNVTTRWDNIRSYYDPRGYASWLADLIGRMHNKEYREKFSDLQSVA